MINNMIMKPDNDKVAWVKIKLDLHQSATTIKTIDSAIETLQLILKENKFDDVTTTFSQQEVFTLKAVKDKISNAMNKVV